MGLDMYAFSVPAGSNINVEGEEDGIERNRVMYWRKHNALHGWMEKLWREKTGDNEHDFNCVPLKLSAEDLDRLENDINQHELHPTEGFFFGSTDYDPDEYKVEDLRFIEDARLELSKGQDVYYDSWW